MSHTRDMYDVVIVGGGALGRQLVLELFKHYEAADETPKVALIDNGDMHGSRDMNGRLVNPTQRWTSTGLSAQTVSNLGATGIRFQDGMNATVRPGADITQLPPVNHDVIAQIPPDLTPKLLQSRFPELLGSYDPLFKDIQDKHPGYFTVVQGNVQATSGTLFDEPDACTVVVSTTDGLRPIRTNGVMFAADGSQSQMRKLMNITMSEPLHGLQIWETAFGITPTADAHEPEPGFVTVDWFNAEQSPGPGGSVLAKTDHGLHVLTTRQIPGESRQWASRAERRSALTRVMHKLRLSEPDRVANFPTAYRRVEDPVRLAPRSGVIMAGGGEFAGIAPPLGGFGVNIILSTIAPAAATMIARVLASNTQDESITAAAEYRETIEHAVGVHHANTMPKFWRFGNLESPTPERHYTKPAIPIEAYFPGQTMRRATPGKVLSFSQ